MEQEAMGLMMVGFFTIMVMMLIAVILLFIFKKQRLFRIAYGLIILYLVLFGCAVLTGLKIFGVNINHPMASEDITLHLGIAGVLWGISMLFLLFAVLSFSKIAVK